MNFNDQQNRRTYESTRGRSSSSGYATRIIEHGAQTAEQAQQATDRPQTNDLRKIHMRLGDVIPRNRSHANQGGNNPSGSGRREVPNTEPLSGGDDTQAGHSRDAASMATAFQPLSMSLETFLVRLSRTKERSEKSRRVFKKPTC